MLFLFPRLARTLSRIARKQSECGRAGYVSRALHSPLSSESTQVDFAAVGHLGAISIAGRLAVREHEKALVVCLDFAYRGDPA